MGGLFETLSGAKGFRAEGASAANIAEQQAQVSEQEGQAAITESQFASKRQAEEAAIRESAATATIATAGGIGSPVAGDLAAGRAEESELENLLIGFEGAVASQQARNQAKSQRFAGQLAKLQGKNAARRANIQFGLQLATLGFLAGFKAPTKTPLGPGLPKVGTVTSQAGASLARF